MDPSLPKYRKIQHLLEKDVPTQTEMRSYMGSSLAQIFNEFSNETNKRLLGIVPPLRGPIKDDLWISPSDQLLGKVALKPPLTNKCVKACTHQGILEIGELAAIELEEVMEERLRKKLEGELKENRKMFEAEKRRAIESNTRAIRNEYEKIINDLNKERETRINTILADAAKKSKDDLTKALIEERILVEAEMMKKLRNEVGSVIDSMNNEFQFALCAQRDNMVADFNNAMRQERKKIDARIEKVDKKREEDMFAQRCELETQNMAETAFVLCTERMCCTSEMQAMRQTFQKQIEALQNLLLDKRKNIQNGDLKNDNQMLDNNEEGSQFFQVVEIIDKEGHSWKPIQLKPEIPQLDCTDEESVSAMVSSEINFFPPDGYTDRISVASAESLHTTDSLPFCYFENNLYVRSDYRENNNDQGIIIEERKTMAELAEGGRFIMELKRSESGSRKKSS